MLLTDILLAWVFILSAKIALKLHNGVTPHFEVVTKAGRIAHGYELKLTLDGKTAILVYGEVVSYIEVMDIRFVVEVTETGAKQMTWNQFLVNANKEK
jgi:hypothetical protein